MMRKVLIVDDDLEMLLSLQEGLGKYDESFSILISGDGLIAAEKLKANTVSVVITDLKMPRMDGFSLLAHIMEHYPEIPVIVITAYSTPKMEGLARQGGAVGYIEKPFMIEDLARKIITTLRKESEGGTLHNVSSGMFLQLMEMEQKTCTIRLSDKSSGRQGILFFRDGELLDARVDGLRAENAAHEIFSWENVSLSIQNDCPVDDKRIQGELQAILLEAMRLKDEYSTNDPSGPETEEVEIVELMSEPELAEKPNFMDQVRGKLEREVGERCGVEDIYKDTSWDALVAQMARVGVFFRAGQLKLGYVDKGSSNDFIIFPGDETTVVSVRSTCPRDKIIEVLAG